jgi:hypothetical protein
VIRLDPRRPTRDGATGANRSHVARPIVSEGAPTPPPSLRVRTPSEGRPPASTGAAPAARSAPACRPRSGLSTLPGCSGRRHSQRRGCGTEAHAFPRPAPGGRAARGRRRRHRARRLTIRSGLGNGCRVPLNHLWAADLSVPPRVDERATQPGPGRGSRVGTRSTRVRRRTVGARSATPGKPGATRPRPGRCVRSGTAHERKAGRALRRAFAAARRGGETPSQVGRHDREPPRRSLGRLPAANQSAPAREARTRLNRVNCVANGGAARRHAQPARSIRRCLGNRVESGSPAAADPPAPFRCMRTSAAPGRRFRLRSQTTRGPAPAVDRGSRAREDVCADPTATLPPPEGSNARLHGDMLTRSRFIEREAA